MCKDAILVAVGMALSGMAMGQEVAEADAVLVENETRLLTGWAGNVSFGLTGSDGNTERLNLRGEVDGTRETDEHVTSFLSTYSYAEDAGTKSEDRFNTEVRNDFVIDDSDWFVFVRGQFESDSFQDWNQRLSIFAGPGRVFIDNDKTKLQGSVGVGAVREFGGANDDWTPEAILSASIEHQVTERQKLAAGVDVLPNLDDTGEVRVNSKIIWELLVDPEVNMSLRAGIVDRYNSDAGGGAKENDVDFFVMLSWAY